MTSITQLTQNISPLIPFANEAAAQNFLGQYSVDDQAALISALYIGRDHLHDHAIRPDYVPVGYVLDRFFTTGRHPNWDISPSDFARILFEKNTNLTTYYDAFLRCTQSYGNVLASF